MSLLGTVEDTLFIPLLGRIYASEHFPALLYDGKALELKAKIPRKIIENDTQKQYTLIASASRSVNMDRYISDFLKRNPEGIVAELGCGLETTFFRNTSPYKAWYCIDLENVIAFRRTILPEEKNMKYIAGDAFRKDWIEEIRKEQPESPILVIASGLFYYFEEDKVLSLMKLLSEYGHVEIAFDTVNKSGMRQMQKKYMKQIGHADAKMFFYVDRADELAGKIGPGAKVLSEVPFYRGIRPRGLERSTSLTMRLSDMLSMVKMVSLSLG